MKTFINGKPESTVPVLNRGLNYGDGFFETLLVKDQTLPFLSYHLQRIRRTAIILDLEINEPELNETLEKALTLYPDEGNFCLKIQFIRETSGRGYGYQSRTCDQIVSVFSEYINRGWQRPPACAGFLKTHITVNQDLAGLKHLNRLDSVIASKELNENGWDEGFFIHNDYVISGSKHNVFLVDSNNCLITPSITIAGIAGVMRQYLIDQFDVVEKPITAQDLYQATSIFLTNALVGIWRVASLDGQQYSDETKLNQIISSIR